PSPFDYFRRVKKCFTNFYTTFYFDLDTICIWFCNWCNSWFNSCNISTCIKVGKGNVLPFSYIVSKYSYHCPCSTSCYLVWIWRASKINRYNVSVLFSYCCLDRKSTRLNSSH